jgi:hypothetical protein
MNPLRLALLITCALLLNETQTATLTKPDTSKTVHESECPCLLCWWCDPEEPHEPPHEEPHDHPVPEIPELPPLPQLPPIPKWCPPSKEEPEIPHYQSNPIIAAASTSSAAMRNYIYMPVPLAFATWGVVAAVGSIHIWLG